MARVLVIAAAALVVAATFSAGAAEPRPADTAGADTLPGKVDADGKIYRDRNYHGIVPGLRHLFTPKHFARLQKRDLVSWTGFVPTDGRSRVFWQLTAPNPTFEVTKIDDKTIEVRLPRTRPHRRNNIRPLIMGKNFGTPIQRVDGRRKGKGTIFRITLAKATPFEHRFEAPFLYLDFKHASSAPGPSSKR